MLRTSASASPPAAVPSRRNETGAAFIEYALLTALIAVVCIVAVTLFGDKTNESFSSSGSALEAISTG